jgi:hypothetical protein
MKTEETIQEMNFLFCSICGITTCGTIISLCVVLCPLLLTALHDRRYRHHATGLNLISVPSIPFIGCAEILNVGLM